MVLPNRSVIWEAPAHYHTEKSSDWYWALGILAVCGGAAALFFGNFLLTILILIAAVIMSLVASREPAIVPYAVTSRGVRIGDTLYPYSTLDAYYIDDDDPRGPQLLVRSQKLFMPLLVMPIDPEQADDIEDILEGKLPEEHMEEPFGSQLLELLGF